MKKLLIALVWVGAITLWPQIPSAVAQTKGLVTYGLQLEELEYRHGDENEHLLAWNGDAFIGTDELKLRWLGGGEYDKDAAAFETVENRLLLQTPVSTFFDVKGGVRLDTPAGSANRWYGVLGVTGLAPQWFEVDADLFVSQSGDASARLDVEYELLLTNRLILTPSVDINLAFSDDAKVDVGAGFSSIETGVRLSYDLIDRSFSPYVGFVYERKLGETADIARDEGEDYEGWRAVIGAKIMF